MQKKYYRGFETLFVHQKADELALKIYQVTRDFPRDEILGLVSQMRRAATSIPANIAEGYTRNGFKEKLRFYNMSQGSTAELKYFTEFSYKLTYLNQADYLFLSNLIDEVGKLLNGFIKSTKLKCTSPQSLATSH